MKFERKLIPKEMSVYTVFQEYRNEDYWNVLSYRKFATTNDKKKAHELFYLCTKEINPTTITSCSLEREKIGTTFEREEICAYPNHREKST